MKRTLLDMVQDILSAANGDEVNSIGDSVEALQVAMEIRTAYDILLQEPNAYNETSIVKLEPSLDPARPTHMKIPENAVELEWIQYNYKSDGKNDWKVIRYLPPHEFLTRSMNMANQDRSLEVFDYSGAPLYILTNQNPTYYTTFDEIYLVFDSYDSDLDTTLQASKTLCWGTTVPEFLFEDDFIPKIRIDLFPRLISEAKAAYFINHKQVSNSKEEQRSRRMSVNLQNRMHRVREKRPNSRTPMDYVRKPV